MVLLKISILSLNIIFGIIDSVLQEQALLLGYFHTFSPKNVLAIEIFKIVIKVSDFERCPKTEIKNKDKETQIVVRPYYI